MSLDPTTAGRVSFHLGHLRLPASVSFGVVMAISRPMRLLRQILALLFCVGCTSIRDKFSTHSNTSADSGNPAVQPARRVPDFPQVVEIIMQAGTSPGWAVRIWRDGDGCLVGGQLLSEGASFPRGTFEFRQVYDSIAGAVESARPSGEYFAVSFFTVSSAGSTPTFFTQDAGAVRLVFDTAKQHCVIRDGDRFEQIWRERPPFPK